MFKKGWSGQALAYVCGTEETCKSFTIDFSWYHSAMGIISSTNTMDNGKIVLNLNMSPENYGGDEELLEKRIREMAEKHGCFAFVDWDEYREREKTSE